MLALFLCAASSSIFSALEERRFVGWMREHGQMYTGSEYQFRLGVFLAKARYVESFNKNPKKSFTVALNKFAAMTDAEYRVLLGYTQSYDERAPARSTRVSTDDLPESVDWRKDGAVNAVKDQAQCGSCWAFSAVCTAESAYFLKSKQLLSFSESNLVDCVNLCMGCSGGVPSVALSYVHKHQGGQWNSETDYPYVAVAQTCKYDATKAIGGLSGFKGIGWAAEDELQEKVAKMGVVSVCVDAGQQSFQSYNGGIYDEPNCGTLLLNHAVACVGYGAENGRLFWIVRNSWGADWGEAGYIRMPRNEGNVCGIATRAVVAFVE